MASSQSIFIPLSLSTDAQSLNSRAQTRAQMLAMRWFGGAVLGLIFFGDFCLGCAQLAKYGPIIIGLPFACVSFLLGISTLRPKGSGLSVWVAACPGLLYWLLSNRGMPTSTAYFTVMALAGALIPLSAFLTIRAWRRADF